MATIGGLTWDTQGEHYYYTGIDGVALYVWDEEKDPEDASTPRGWYGTAVNWDGVTAINESPSGAEPNMLYADNNEYLNLLSKEEFGLTLEAYTVPEAFDACDGIYSVGAMKVRGQGRKSFGLVYRVQKGSDTVEAGKLAYVYHIVYGCKAAPSSRDFATVNDSPEAMTFSYEITTTDLTNTDLMTEFDGVNKAVHFEIDTEDLSSDQIDALVAILYGTASGSTLTPATRMPTPDELSEACATEASNG